VHIEDWCDDIVTSFALQAMIGAAGHENVAAWCDAHPAVEAPGFDGEQPVVDQEGDEDAMEVEIEVLGEDGGGAALTAQLHGARSLVTAFAQYRSGDGLQVELPAVAEAEREGYAKRAVQLLSQLCLVDLPMLSGFVDLYSVWASTVGSAGNAGGRMSPGEDALSADGASEAPAVDGAVAVAAPEIEDTLTSKLGMALMFVPRKSHGIMFDFAVLCYLQPPQLGHCRSLYGRSCATFCPRLAKAIRWS